MFLFDHISHRRNALLIYLLLVRKPFVISKEIWKQGTSPSSSAARVEQERFVDGGERGGGNVQAINQ